jgi:hypothetical protein
LWSLLWDFLLFCMALKVISPATFDQNMISITTARLVQERKWKHKKKEMGNWAPCRLCLRLSLFPVSSCFCLLFSVLRWLSCKFCSKILALICKQIGFYHSRTRTLLIHFNF